jgi:hypothetical protein
MKQNFFMVYFLGVPLGEELFYIRLNGRICTKKKCQCPLAAGL